VQDYALRAKDHKAKQKTLRSLRQKAADRNEDEFNYAMLSRAAPGSRLSEGRRWTGTVAGDRGNKSLGVDAVRLLKTQDAGYVRTARSVAAKAVRRLEERAVLAGQWAGEADAALRDDEGDGDEDEDDDEDGENRFAGRQARTRQKPPRRIVFVDPAELEGMGDDDDDDRGKGAPPKDGQAEKAARLRRKLQNARKRLRALTDASTELDLQRARMSKTPTVGGVTKRGNRFKIRERKR